MTTRKKPLRERLSPADLVADPAYQSGNPNKGEPFAGESLTAVGVPPGEGTYDTLKRRRAAGEAPAQWSPVG